jgi:hypothetical protein
LYHGGKLNGVLIWRLMNSDSAEEIFEEIGTHLSSLKHTGRCPDDEITTRLKKCKELLINLDGTFAILHLNYGELTEALCEQADEYIKIRPRLGSVSYT